MRIGRPSLFSIYNALLFLLLPVAVPPALAFMGFKDKYRSQIKGRFGIGLDIRPLEGRYPRIWVHALSLGEVNAALPFVKAAAERWPRAGIICSASTKTGIAALKKALKGRAHVIAPMPFDLPFIAARFIRRLSPDCLVLVETDLWPNIIRQCGFRNTPVLLINGSISSQAQKRLKRLGRAFIDLIYGGIVHVAAQSEADRARFAGLGLPEDRLSVAGNLKYDIKCTETEGATSSGDKKRGFGFREDGPVFVAGSTHKGEEEVIFKAFMAIKREFPALRLIIAPRDTARGNELVAMAKEFGIIVNKRSAGPGEKEIDALILDTLGELKDCYLAADIAFVGGSLVDVGGHNILEPAACGVPVIFGPNIESFRYAADELVANRAGIYVRDAKGLEDAILSLLRDKDMRVDMGRRAKAVIAGNSGATIHYIKLLEKYIKGAA